MLIDQTKLVDRRVVIIPNEEELKERLAQLKVDADVTENFHPLLLQNAGQDKKAGDICMMLLMAIRKYNIGKEKGIVKSMYLFSDIYIDVLVSDEDVNAVTKVHS